MSGKQWAVWAGRGLLAAAVGAGVWQAASAVRLNREAEAQDERQRAIDQAWQTDTARTELSAQLHADLLAGRLTLREAAERFVTLYAHLPGAMVTISMRCPGRPPVEQVAMHLVLRSEQDADVPRAVVARLKSEFIHQYVMAEPLPTRATDRRVSWGGPAIEVPGVEVPRSMTTTGQWVR